MRKQNLGLLLAALMFAIIGLSTPANAQEYIWGSSQWGSNPFDRDRDSAIRRVEEGLRPMSLPQAAKDCLAEAVRRNPQGERHSIEDGDRFVEMQSGGGLEHNVLVRVGDSQQERGRVPSARKWECSIDGQTYTLVLPDICHNWAWFSEPSPREVTSEEECTTVAVAVHEGDTLAPAVFTGGSLPPSRCWAFKQSGDWEAWPGGCDHCIQWAPALERVPSADRRVRMPGLVRIERTGTVWVRVPRQVEREGYHVAFILLRDGLCSWGVIHHSDWSEHAFTISEGNWVWRPQQ